MKAQNEWQRQIDELKIEVARLKEAQRYFAQLLVIAYMNDDTVSTSPEMQRHLAYLHGQSGND